MKIRLISDVYQNKSTSVIKKAKILQVCFISTIFAFIPAALQMFSEGNIPLFVLDLVLVVTAAVGSFLLWKGYYKISWLLCNLIIASLALSRILTWPDSYYTVLYGLFMACVMVQFGVQHLTSRWNIILFHIFLYGVVLGTLAAVSVPYAVENKSLPLMFDMFFGSFCIFVFSDVLFFVGWKADNDLNRELTEKESELRKNIGHISNIVGKVSSGADIGNQLTETSHAISDSLLAMEECKNETRRGQKSLESQIEGIYGLQNQIAEANESVKIRINNQAAAFEQTTAAITEMSSSIETMSGNATEKMAQLMEISSAVKTGIEQLESSARIFEEIISSINRMSEIVGVIEDISERTNLLAMNASIESVHAGDAGKGFSIVAQSIRDLSEETSRNSKIISQMIKTNISAVKNAVTVNSESSLKIRGIGNDLLVISSSLNEISNGLSELAKGTVEINNAVYHVVDLKKEVDLSTERMNRIIADENSAMNVMKDVVCEIDSSMKNLENEFGRIREKSDLLLNIGATNEELMKEMKDSVSGFQSR